jgi:uncharacterized cupin superfamily protein
MNKVNIRDVPEEHRISPKGRFELRRKHVSLALGGKKDVGPWGGGHPFDIELACLPPGKANFPLHSHAAQTEHYAILSGSGILLDGNEVATRIEAGDHIICHPEEAHQITNDGSEDLVYYVITDHHRAEVGTYLRTGKRYIKPEYRTIDAVNVDYYEGEE